MKATLLILLVMSLAGNALLAVRALRSRIFQTSEEVSPSDAVVAPETTTPAEPDASEARQEPYASGAQSWRGARSPAEIRSTIDALRSAGFSPSVLRMVANQLVAESLKSRNPQAKVPFWKFHFPSKEQVLAMEAHRKEHAALQESVLGDAARPSVFLEPEYRLQRYGNIRDEKVDLVARIEQDYSEVQNRVTSEQMRSGDGTSYLEQRQALEMEKMADVAAVLTPEEFEQYELRSSRTVGHLASRLRGIDVNESEYIALFRLQKSFDASAASYTGPASVGARRSATLALLDGAREVLPDERFLSFVEAADSNFRRVAQAVTKLDGATAATAYEVYRLQTELQAKVFSPDTRPSASERATLMAGYNERLERLLGPEAANEYRNDGNGRIFLTSPPGPNVRAVDAGRP